LAQVIAALGEKDMRNKTKYTEAPEDIAESIEKGKIL